MESPMALLAAVFCADTYIQEILSGRYQIQRLYPLKNRLASMAKRLMIQEAFLLFLSAAGYGMYLLVQRPVLLNGEERGENSSVAIFLIYLGAVFVSLLFWGLLSHVLSCCFGVFLLFQSGGQRGSELAVGEIAVCGYPSGLYASENRKEKGIKL